jgi:hypothetical protein
MLLDWTIKPPHMQIEINELERIIKKLNGKIDASSGGSHHRIIFKNSLAFVDAFEQSPTANTVKEKTVKGTLVKQHGSAKSSRCLPSYAIKTFMQTLQKMGVTQTILKIYTRTWEKCATGTPFYKEAKALLLTNAQIALEKDQIKMLLFLSIYKSKKGARTNLKKLDQTLPGRKPTEEAQHLIQRIFSFLGYIKQK